MFLTSLIQNKDGKTRAFVSGRDYLDAFQSVPLLKKPVGTSGVHIRTGKDPPDAFAKYAPTALPSCTKQKPRKNKSAKKIP